MRRQRFALLALAATTAAGVVLIDVAGDASGAELGPIFAVTPDHVSTTVEAGSRASVVARGVVVGAAVTVKPPDGSGAGHAVPRVGIAEFDDVLTNGLYDGYEVAVSGDGCAALFVGLSHDVDALYLIDRCRDDDGEPGVDPQLVYAVEGSFQRLAAPVLNERGDVGAVIVEEETEEGSFSHVILIRLLSGASATAEVLPLPLDGPLEGAEADANFGLDISPEGNTVVATLRLPYVIVESADADDGSTAPPPPPPPPPTPEDLLPGGRGPVVAVARSAVAEDGRETVVVAWDRVQTRTGSLWNPELIGTNAMFPSVSSNGDYVAYTGFDEPNDTVDGDGPWVYVTARDETLPVLVSEAEQRSGYTSLSDDGTQIAYVTVSDQPAACESRTCRSGATIVVVAYGSSPGLTGPITRDAISVPPEGKPVGWNTAPALSPDGRAVAWSSDAADEIVGTESSKHVLMRRRATGLTVGDVALGTVARDTAAIGTAVVTNTGTTTISIDVVRASVGPFTVVGGTCAMDTTLPPGGMCTVDVRFDAGTLEGAVSATLTVGEEGFDAVSASGRLSADVPAKPDPPTPDPPTPDPPTPDPPTPDPPTPDPPTPDPEPVTAHFVAAPSPVQFGITVVGTPSTPSSVVITNDGDSSATPQVGLAGIHAGDFAIVADTCSTASLVPGETCRIDMVATPAAGGEREGALTLRADGASLDVPLRTEAHYQPRLRVTPEAVTERGQMTIIGIGFPPNEPVELHVGQITITGHPDATGTMRVPFSPLGQLRLGSQTVTVDGRPRLHGTVQAAFAVVLGTFEPHGPTGPVIRSSSFVTRGR